MLLVNRQRHRLKGFSPEKISNPVTRVCALLACLHMHTAQESDGKDWKTDNVEPLRDTNSQAKFPKASCAAGLMGTPPSDPCLQTVCVDQMANMFRIRGRTK
jgi:hypothetical protein